MNRLKNKFSLKKIYEDKFSICLILILIAGFAVRFINLDNMPCGLNQDEAFAGYEAFSILHYGKDTYGYAYPVYLTAWGSGMNALYSYLTIPFIFLNGGRLNIFVIRLPQCILACITLVVFYLIVKRISKDRKAALIALMLIAINPWHIMLSRWGLEANIAPAFLMFGLYFWIRGVEKSKYFIFSAIFYGLSLYCYAPLWIVVPIILLMQFSYCCYYKKIKFNKDIIISIGILIILAMPLMLFVLVNKGLINEIKTQFISIPKMDAFRSGEVSLRNIKNSTHLFVDLIISQTDNLPHNVINSFGIYYKFSLPLILIGLLKSLKNIVTDIKEKKFTSEFLILSNLIGALFLACIMDPINVNKINCIHIPMIFYCSYGVFYLLKRFNVLIGNIILTLYLISFVFFVSCYFTEYQSTVALSFQKGYDTAILAALEKNDNNIYVTDEIYYPKILFLEQTPVNQFIESKKQSQTDGNRLKIGRIIYGINIDSLSDKSVYVISDNNLNLFKDRGFKTDKYDNFYVVYKN